MQKESDLAPPVCSFLKERGYTVRSEVKDCDIVAIKDEQLVIVELKRGVTVDLLLQATDRQRTADAVFVAVPFTGKGQERYGRRWQGIERLLKRLELGLLLIHPGKEGGEVEVVFDPQTAPKVRAKPRQRAGIFREVAARSEDYNVGGSTRRPLLTAYREQAIRIAFCLERFGPQSPAFLRQCGCSPRTLTILRGNPYEWFEKVARGIYRVKPSVADEITALWPEFAGKCWATVPPFSQ